MNIKWCTLGLPRIFLLSTWSRLSCFPQFFTPPSPYKGIKHPFLTSVGDLCWSVSGRGCDGLCIHRHVAAGVCQSRTRFHQHFCRQGYSCSLMTKIKSEEKPTWTSLTARSSCQCLMWTISRQGRKALSFGVCNAAWACEIWLMQFPDHKGKWVCTPPSPGPNLNRRVRSLEVL